MKRFLLTLGIAAGLAGCTLTAEDLTIDTPIKKIVVDKDTALAYTEVAMKQAGMSAAAVTAGVPAGGNVVSAPRIGRASFRPLFQKLAVTADQCVQYTDVACTDAGVCSYVEDYTACGTDFGGKIKREFSGTYETYSIKVNFENYSEKPSTDTGHYAFNGLSSMDGQLGYESASLNLHTDGEGASYLGDVLVHIKSSLTVSFKVVGTTLTIDGTQAGTIVESGQAGTLTITGLTFDDTCAQGPTKGTVKTIIDNIETVTTITGCGKGTIVVAGGEASAIDGAQLADTFVPEEGQEEAGFGGIVDGTSGGSLLSGDWVYTDAENYKSISLYDYDGVLSIWYYDEQDMGPNGYFYDDGDYYSYGNGIVAYDDTQVTITWDSFSTYQIDSLNGDQIIVSCSSSSTLCVDETYSYSLVGSDQLIIGGLTYTRVVYDYGADVPVCTNCAPKR